MNGHSIAGMSVDRERVKDDYYATPPEATDVLLYDLDLSECKTFLEPSCGEGHISKVLESWFVHTGMSEVESCDLVYRGYGNGGIDFLNSNYYNGKKYDCVITNPPFKLAKEFVQRGMDLSNKYVIMFAKLQLLEGVGRKELFDKYPPKYIYVFRNRINPYRNGNPLDEKGKPWASTMCFAWFVFEVGFSGEPTIRWLQTNKLSSKQKNTQEESRE